jgi:hypothetical protein
MNTLTKQLIYIIEYSVFGKEDEIMVDSEMRNNKHFHNLFLFIVSGGY